MVAVRSAEKSEFVQALLSKDGTANAQAVNSAWKAAGHEGTISTTLVQKLRSRMGLTGNLRGASKPARGNAASRKKSARAVAGVSRRTRGVPAATNRRKARGTNGSHTALKSERPSRSVDLDRSRALEEIEGDIDRLIFRLMAIGELPEVEETLRRARRMIVRSLQA